LFLLNILSNLIVDKRGDPLPGALREPLELGGAVAAQLPAVAVPAAGRGAGRGGPAGVREGAARGRRPRPLRQAHVGAAVHGPRGAVAAARLRLPLSDARLVNQLAKLCIPKIEKCLKYILER